MVERVIKPGGIRSEAVIKSISETLRHLFVPKTCVIKRTLTVRFRSENFKQLAVRSSLH